MEQFMHVIHEAHDWVSTGEQRNLSRDENGRLLGLSGEIHRLALSAQTLDVRLSLLNALKPIRVFFKGYGDSVIAHFGQIVEDRMVEIESMDLAGVN